jgi:hypothetical protein
VPGATRAEGTRLPAGEGLGPVPPAVSEGMAVPMLEAVPLLEGTAVTAPGEALVDASPTPAPVLRVTPPESGMSVLRNPPRPKPGAAGTGALGIMGAFPSSSPLGESARGAGTVGTDGTVLVVDGEGMVSEAMLGSAGTARTTEVGWTGSGAAVSPALVSTAGAGVALTTPVGLVFDLGLSFALTKPGTVANTTAAARAMTLQEIERENVFIQTVIGEEAASGSEETLKKRRSGSPAPE